MNKLFAALAVAAMAVFGPVGAQAEKNDVAANAMSKMVPASSAEAASLSAFPDASASSLPGVSEEPTRVRKPDPTITWLLALGFLGLVVLRRTRSGHLL
jgi:hypothetical protein